MISSHECNYLCSAIRCTYIHMHELSTFVREGVGFVYDKTGLLNALEYCMHTWYYVACGLNLPSRR